MGRFPLPAALALVLLIPQLPTKSQDKSASLLRLNSRMDTWYQINRGEAQVGFARTVLNPYGATKEAPVEFSEDVQADFVETGRRLPVVETMRAGLALPAPDGKDPKSVTIAEFSYKHSFNNRESSAKLDRAKNELEITHTNGKKDAISLKGRQNAYLHPSMALLALVQEGRLMSRPTHELTVLLPSENEGLALEKLEVRIVGPETRRYLGQLVPTTHVTVEKGPTYYDVSNWYIDAFGRILEFSTTANIKCFINRDEQTSKIVRDIDTWYRLIQTVEQREGHVGWAHTWVRSQPEGGFSITWERQLNYGLLETRYPFTEKFQAKTDAAFNVGQFELHQTFAHEEAWIKLEGSKLTIHDVTGKESVLEVQKEDRFVLDLALLATMQRDELFGAKRHLVRLLLTKAPRIGEAEFEIVGPTRREYLGATVYVIQGKLPVDRRMNPKTNQEEIVYMDVFLDKFGRILEKGTSDGLRQVICRSEQEAKVAGANIPLQASAMRDPFDKWSVLSPTKPPPVEIKPAGPDPSKLEAALKQARTTVEKLAAASNDELKGLLEDYQKLKAQFDLDFAKFTDPSFHVRRAANEMKTLEEKVRELVPPGRLDEIEFEALCREVKSHIAKEEVEPAKSMMLKIEEMLRREGVRESPKLVKKIEEFVAWGKSEVETLEVQLKLRSIEVDVSAIAWEMKVTMRPVVVRINVYGTPVEVVQQVKVMTPGGYAVLDGKVYGLGDTIELKELALKVGEINKDSVKLIFERGGKTVEKVFYLHK